MQVSGLLNSHSMLGTDAPFLFLYVVENVGLDQVLDLLSFFFVWKPFDRTIKVQVSISNVTMAYHNAFFSYDLLGFLD